MILIVDYLSTQNGTALLLANAIMQSQIEGREKAAQSTNQSSAFIYFLSPEVIEILLLWKIKTKRKRKTISREDFGWGG